MIDTIMHEISHYWRDHKKVVIGVLVIIAIAYIL